MRFIKLKKETNLDKEINSILLRMSETDPASEQYSNMAKIVEGLLDVKSKQKDHRISPDTVAVILGNLLGIVLILKHEEINVITSKALGFVLRGRV